MATCFHWLIMGKVKIGLYCYLITDILTKFYRNALPNISVLSKPLNLITCHGNRNSKFVKKYSKSHLLRIYKGDKDETLREMFRTLASTKVFFFFVLFFFAVAHVPLLLWQL